mgnify:CR=1 FL=1
MRFRPCIDLHKGIVKQIVGSTLTDENGGILETNFQSEKPSEWFAELYRKDRLTGGHIIQLGSGNEKATQAALSAWPGGMQVGGGINIDNAAYWLDSGAGAVIVTSWVFHDGNIDEERLKSLVKLTGKEKLVLDLSCRRQGQSYKVVTNRWQTFTDEVISFDLLDYLSGFCSEFLIHAVDVEGKCAGIEKELAEKLGQWVTIPTTYAGGVKNIADMECLEELGHNRLDATIGSALDIFGGSTITYADAVAFHNSSSAR